MIRAREWQLIRLDPPNAGQEFSAQFLAENFSEDASTTWATLNVPKRTAPVEQWIHGDAELVSFTARVYHDPRQDEATRFTGLALDPYSRVQAMKALMAPEKALGRPPKFRFVWGQHEFDCFVESIGGIRYDTPRDNGEVRGAVFDVRLRKAGDDYELEATDPSAPVPKSRHKPVPFSGTFESLAGAYYGDPMIGVLVRQDSKLAFPAPGVVVALERIQNYAGRPATARSYALSDSTLASFLAASSAL